MAILPSWCYQEEKIRSKRAGVFCIWSSFWNIIYFVWCLQYLKKKRNNVQLLSLFLKHIIISRGSRVSETYYHGTHSVSWLGWTSVTLHGNWPSWLLVTLLGSFEHEKLWWLQGCFLKYQQFQNHCTFLHKLSIIYQLGLEEIGRKGA